jgi:hypothetical protein
MNWHEKGHAHVCVISNTTMQEAFMSEFINTLEFTRPLFDNEKDAATAADIAQAILDATSPRISDISHHMPGGPAANYKAVQRFLDRTDPREALLRLFQPDAPFVIGDPTEMSRPYARKTSYVGTLSDEKTPGFWLLVLATPFRGRAIPCSFVTYSSRTINDQCTSRNLEHWRAFAGVHELLGDRPLVLDREFSYLELMKNLVAEGINYVIRLNLGRQQPTLFNAEGRSIKLRLAQGQERTYHQLLYKGEVRVNISGIWRPGLKEPLWVMSNLQPQEAMAFYQARTKIEESFRDLKSLLSMEKIMNKKQTNMEKMMAMVMISYAIGCLVGESIRDAIYGPETAARPTEDRGDRTIEKPKREKRSLYSGLFILLKQKIDLAIEELEALVQGVLVVFIGMVLGDVRTLV